MIYLFGDSWGFSYKQVAPQTVFHDSQVFDGQDLGCLISGMSNIQIYNLAKRGMDLNSIVLRITKLKELFIAGDTVIVLQTDPFRSFFVKWYATEMVSHNIKIDTPMTLIDVCEQKLLETFYRKLSVLQKMFNIKILLHGGLSRINHDRAISAGLDCTEYSSTEIIAKHLGKDLQDNYFIANNYTIANHEYLENNYEQYIKGQDISLILQMTENKRIFWSENPEYFTHDHTTEKGSRIVAEYLCDCLKKRDLLWNRN